MPAFLIRYRLPLISNAVLTDELITPDGWSQPQAANYFTAAFCPSAHIIDCWQEDSIPADLHRNSQPVLSPSAS